MGCRQLKIYQKPTVPLLTEKIWNYLYGQVDLEKIKRASGQTLGEGTDIDNAMLHQTFLLIPIISEVCSILTQQTNVSLGHAI